MSFLQSKGLLNIIYTQNIDALELKAKVNREKMVFAHGHVSSAHCSDCQKPHDIDKFNENVKTGTLYYCEDLTCNKPVKPSVVLYGENLPKEVTENFKVNLILNIQALQDSDLVFIMGTSLNVMPFSYFPHQLDKKCQRVLVNMEKVGHGFKFDDLSSNDYFIPGYTDEIILKLITDLGWKEEFETYIKP
jgi:NAD-dependent histone deacetylase SIR2